MGSGQPLRLKKLWRIRRCPLLQEYEAKAKKLGTPTQLFHGTRMSSAQKIATDGFKLPTYGGLYGKGIYFASNPHKSASYAPESSWSPFFRRWWEKGFVDAISRNSEGQMLLCDVFLGSTKLVLGTWSQISPEEDLKGGWFRKTFGIGGYNSVYAPGVLGHTEYIVYEEHQAVPRYLFEFEYA